MRIALIPLDKANHVAYGALAALAGAWAAVAAGYADAARGAGFGAALLIGLAKELRDYMANARAVAAGAVPRHGVEWRDVLATAIGGALVAAAP